MMEQASQPSSVTSLQAGPDEDDTSTRSDVNVRINDRAARAIGRQLAEIGDQLDRDWASRLQNQWPTAVQIPRFAQTLSRTFYREIQHQGVGLHGLSAVLKAWLAATTPGQGILRAEAWTGWVSSITYTGWTTGIIVTVALVATPAICTALWVAWKG